jgi:hypothetical protein
MRNNHLRSMHHQHTFALMTHNRRLPKRSRGMLVVEQECRGVALQMVDHILRVRVFA